MSMLPAELVSTSPFDPTVYSGSFIMNGGIDKAQTAMLVFDSKAPQLYGPWKETPNLVRNTTANDDAVAAYEGEILFTIRDRFAANPYNVATGYHAPKNRARRNEVIGFVNARVLQPISYQLPPGAPYTDADDATKEKVELVISELERSIVPCGIVIPPDSRGDTGGKFAILKFGAISMLNTTKNEWRAGTPAVVRVPRPWELPQSTALPTFQSGERPTLTLAPLDRDRQLWEARDTIKECVTRIRALITQAHDKFNAEAVHETRGRGDDVEDLAKRKFNEYFMNLDHPALGMTVDEATAEAFSRDGVTLTPGGLFLVDDCHRAWYLTILGSAVLHPVNDDLHTALQSTLDVFAAAVENPLTMARSIGLLITGIRSLVSLFDSVIVGRFETSANPGQRCELFVKF